MQRPVGNDDAFALALASGTAVDSLQIVKSFVDVIAASFVSVLLTFKIQLSCIVDIKCIGSVSVTLVSSDGDGTVHLFRRRANGFWTSVRTPVETF